MTLREWEHALLRKVYETRSLFILLLVFLSELLEVYCLICNVLRTLLIGFETESVAALVHVHWAKAEAKDVEFACLTRALSIALTINHLFIMSTLSDFFHSRFQTCSFMINQSIGAYRSAHIAFCHSEAWWARWVPLIFTLLTVSALLRLPVAAPKRERLLTTTRSLFEEFGAAIVVLGFVITDQIVI